MNKAKSFVARVLKRTMFFAFSVFPVKKNRILISSYMGRGYGDNLKYLAEELLRRDEDIEIIWVVSNEREASTLPKEIKPCRYCSFSFFYYMTTAGVWIDNCRKGYFTKKKKQLYIQTWHGGGAQKKSELDVKDKLSPIYVDFAIHDSANVDLMISESRFMTDLYHKSFWYDGPVYECGYPRYDIFIDPKEDFKKKVCSFYGIDSDKGLLLYAPTFRADNSFDAYNIDFPRLLNNLKNKFGREYVALIHLHPNIANMEGGIDYDGKSVINSTFYPDMQELIAASDILIGDYSSVNYDFCLRGLPVFRYAADIDEYKNDRDFYFAFDEYPYPYASTNDELEELIENFELDSYLDNLEKFFERLGAVRDGHASLKAADLICDYISSNSDKNEFLNTHKELFIYKKA